MFVGHEVAFKLFKVLSNTMPEIDPVCHYSMRANTEQILWRKAATGASIIGQYVPHVQSHSAANHNNLSRHQVSSQYPRQ